MASLVTRVADQTQAQWVIIKYRLNHRTSCDETNTCLGARACCNLAALKLISSNLIFLKLEIGNSQWLVYAN